VYESGGGGHEKRTYRRPFTITNAVRRTREFGGEFWGPSALTPEKIEFIGLAVMKFPAVLSEGLKFETLQALSNRQNQSFSSPPYTH